MHWETISVTPTPEESTTDNAVMNYSRRNVELIAYNAIVRDAIPRTRRYPETIYRLIPKVILVMSKHIQARIHFQLARLFFFSNNTSLI